MGKNNHEELLGGAPEATSNKQTVEDNLLGRPHVAEKSFAPEAKKDALAPKTPEERFAELQRLTSVYLSEDDEAMLAKAFRFASEAHEGQCRKSGEPFVAHPVEVAIILADLRMDVETLCAALLHDTVEDTSVTRDQVEAEFNPQVAQLVEGVTKITRIEVESLTDEQAATIRKMFVAMSKDIRVIVIKLADRLHNMRTLGALREDRRIFKARETLEIYAPIAHRLGINNIKWELEDLSFYYLEPNKFKQISRMVTESRSEREGYLDQIISILHDEIKGEHPGADHGPPEAPLLHLPEDDEEGQGPEIYDLIAVRVIVKSVKGLLLGFSAVHTLWHPMPGRFKITSPCRSSTCTRACTPRSSGRRPSAGGPDPHRGHASAKRVWRGGRTGATRRRAARKRRRAGPAAGVAAPDGGLAGRVADSREFLKDPKVDLRPPRGVRVHAERRGHQRVQPVRRRVDFAYAIHTGGGAPLRGREGERRSSCRWITSCSWATARDILTQKSVVLRATGWAS